MTTNETSEGEEEQIQNNLLHPNSVQSPSSLSTLLPIHHDYHFHHHHQQLHHPSPPLRSRSTSSTSDFDYLQSTPHPYHHSEDELMISPTPSNSSFQSRCQSKSPDVEEKEEKDDKEERDELIGGYEDCRSDDDKERSERGKRNKRLNKSATMKLTEWLVDHLGIFFFFFSFSIVNLI